MRKIAGIDFSTKSVFLLDLDDTLINTTAATEWGLRRAYNRLCAEYRGQGSLCDCLPFADFKKEIYDIYGHGDETGKRFREIEVAVIEEYCQENLPKKNLRFSHNLFALAARLYWDYRDGKNGALMPQPNVYELFQAIKGYGYAYCVTEGRCNYQHTKLMRTGLESEFEDIIVIKENKERELKSYVDKMSSERKIGKTAFVMIGDSPKDVLAGYNSGIETIRIRNGKHENEMAILEAEESFNSLDRLIERLRDKK